MRSLRSTLSQFRKSEDGVALVEFALFLPLFLLSLFVIVEFSRVFFSYQGAIVGVRDAARYMARVAPEGICVGASDGTGGVLTFSNPDGNGGSVSASYAIVYRNMENESNVLPTNVEILNVVSTYVCEVPAPGTYRQDEVPVAQVSADIRITLPLVGILELNGQPLIPPITHTITDRSRIFGV